jgi:hypothetical protein
MQEPGLQGMGARGAGFPDTGMPSLQGGNAEKLQAFAEDRQEGEIDQEKKGRIQLGSITLVPAARTILDSRAAFF